MGGRTFNFVSKNSEFLQESIEFFVDFSIFVDCSRKSAFFFPAFLVIVAFRTPNVSTNERSTFFRRTHQGDGVTGLDQ